MGSIDWNRQTWDDPKNWLHFGDSWTFHAEACGQPYEDWKSSVVSTFLEPFLGPEIDMLEIAPGYGRWTEYMIGRVQSLTLVDLSPTCIERCRERFGDDENDIAFHVNDGRSLPVGEESIDVVWSFSSFVHIDAPEIGAYLKEIRRVLRPGGRFLIHHSGWPDWTLMLAPVTRHFGKPGKAVMNRTAQGMWRHTGNRSPMSAERFATLASRAGLKVESQVRLWGEGERYGVAFRDVISSGALPTRPTARATAEDSIAR